MAADLEFHFLIQDGVVFNTGVVHPGDVTHIGAGRDGQNRRHHAQHQHKAYDSFFHFLSLSFLILKGVLIPG